LDSILSRLRESVVEGEEEKVEEYTQKSVDEGIDLVAILERGLVTGITEIGERWVKEEAFITEVLLSANAMEAGMKIIRREMERTGKVRRSLGKVILGTVKGDIHNLGKNIVAALLTASGFEVYDIGIDIPAEVFVEKVKELKPNVLGLSSLMTITIPEQGEVIEALRKAGLRDRVKVIIGGAPVTAQWAEEIGADAYGRDAIGAVKKIKEMLGV
jgi:corrinoid protein of di/trimethylamine methyltransferase